MNSKKIALSGVIVAILITTKYVLGFIPGVEITTALIALIVAFLPWKNSLLIVSSFIFMVGVIYGFATWWIMYWFIFGAEWFVITLCKKKINHPIILGIIAALFALTIPIWYFGFNLVLFGKNYAIIHIGTAMITNTIEAIVIMVTTILLFYPLQKIILTAFNKEEGYEIKKMNFSEKHFNI